MLRRIRRWATRRLIDSEVIGSWTNSQIWLSTSCFQWAATFVVTNQIVGDYAEFGVYRGDRFALMHRLLRDMGARHAAANGIENIFPQRRFHAFDSFEGLPESATAYRPAQYKTGAYSAAEEVFRRTVKEVSPEKLTVTKGWFDKTLTPATAERVGLKRLAAAFIDCDVRESADPVMEFLTPLIDTGTVLIFDDWFQNRGHPEHGVQGAVRDWQRRNSGIELQPFHASDAKTWAFIVRR